jgi:hypothetical protein
MPPIRLDAPSGLSGCPPRKSRGARQNCSLSKAKKLQGLTGRTTVPNEHGPVGAGPMALCFFLSLSWRFSGPLACNWKVVREKDGHTLVTGIWTLSQDGNTLSDHFSANRPNGSTSTVDYSYKRTTAGSGFEGTWVSTSEPHSPFELQILPYEADGLSFMFPAEHETQNVKFDGKDYPDVGPNVYPGSESSGRRSTIVR